MGNHPVDTQITADNIREYQVILPANGAPPPAVPVQANAVIQSQEVAQVQEIISLWRFVCFFLVFSLYLVVLAFFICPVPSFYSPYVCPAGFCYSATVFACLHF